MLAIRKESALLFLLSLFLAATTSTDAGILKGFETTEVPELDDIPDIAAVIDSRRRERNLQWGGENATTTTSVSEDSPTSVSEDSPSVDSPTSVSSGSSKGSRSGSSKGRSSSSKGSKTSKRRRPVYTRPEIPVSTPEFSDEGELSFVILLDEFGYSTTEVSIGTRFAFTGRLSTDSYRVGDSNGVCTIGSDINENFALCTFYLRFFTEGPHSFGTVALTGNTDEVGGYLQVTGAGGDLADTPQGSANVVFDPAGNPLVYLRIRLHE